MSLSTFFEARSVAVIGASKTPGKIGHEILKNLALYEYKGKVYPVNPKEKEILGMKCYKTVSEIENEVELAVIAIPPKSVPGVVEECGRKGVRGIVIVSGGFKELGDEGREIEEQIVSIARKYGMRIIGPNCIGIYDSRSKIDTFFQSRERMMRPKEGAVSFITQSGTFGCSFLEWAAEEGIGVARFVSYGNRADVDEPELIEFLGEDERTRVIAVYMEGVGDGRRLMQSISKTSRRKPVLILKAGRTKAGSRVALSHTGWLAGEDRIFDSAIKQAGGIRAENMEELQDMIKALVKQPLPKGNRIGMVTNGAGPCVMAADSIVERGMKMAELSQETLDLLKRELPPYCVPGNPVDLTGSATSKDYDVAIRLLMEEERVDIVMPFFVFQDTPLDEGIIEVMLRIKEEYPEKPIICGASGANYTRKKTKELEEIGIPVYPTPERAVSAAYALWTYSLIRQSRQ